MQPTSSYRVPVLIDRLGRVSAITTPQARAVARHYVERARKANLR